MAGRMEGKISFITGAGRGQGRAHAVLQAREGADIIAVDICEDIESNPYPMAGWDDLMQTKALVEQAGRRCVAVKADVRNREQLDKALAQGVAELGQLTTVMANAGILPLAMGDPQPMDFQDAVDVDLIGVMNTVAVSVPHLSRRRPTPGPSWDPAGPATAGRSRRWSATRSRWLCTWRPPASVSTWCIPRTATPT
jgi:NAD(P)-dependent dehydrogenase (short-subunit alcohol dehydrogenase family)